MGRIEENLFFRRKDLFTPSPDLLFFDITLVYFEFPGNTRDATAFSAVIEQMRNRFGIRRVILVGDRGMFHAKVISRIEELGMEYIAGVRMRSVWDVRKIVLANKDPFETVTGPSR